MKKYLIVFSAMITVALLAGCSKKTVKTDEKDFSSTYYLTNDTTKGKLLVELQVEIPSKFKNDTILRYIRSTVITNLFGEEYIKFSNDSVVNMFVADLKRDYVSDNLGFIQSLSGVEQKRTSIYNEHNYQGYSLLSDENIYTYGIDKYVFMGGAHGMETRFFFNFNLHTGKLITESDLFVKNYTLPLSELIKKRIVEESKEDKDDDPIISLEDTDYWTESIKPNGNFYITDESINYVFNPYEIAPYYMGETEVSLPFERLKGLMNDKNPIQYLITKHLLQLK